MTTPSAPLASPLRQLLSMLPPQQRSRALSLGLLMTLAGLSEMVTVGSIVPFLALLADGGVGSGWRLPLAPPSLTSAAALFLAAAVVAGGLRLLLNWQTQRFALEAGHQIAVQAQQQILAQPYSYHVQAHSSTALAALEKVQDLVWSVVMPLVQGASAAIMSVLILSVLVWLDPGAALGSAVLLGGLYLLVSLAVRQRLRRDAETAGVAYEQRIRLVQDSLGGVRDILIDGSQAVHLAAFREMDRRFVTARARLGFLSSAPRYIIEAVGLGVVLLMTLLLAAREGGLVAALPLLGALALGAQRLLPLLQQLYGSWSALAGHARVIADLQQLLSLPDEQAGKPSQPLSFRSGLRLEGICFRYPGRNRPALQDVSLTIRKGHRVALVGRTGSGKSTLADLIMGLLEPDAGRILVDGEELGRGRLAAWRQNIAHVPQSIFLTAGTILENIAFGVPPGQVDQTRLQRAIEVAQLDEMIAQLPRGLETPVGERGVRLSGGQRQRMALARAVYRSKPVLVLDEATSELDVTTESAVRDALDQLQIQGLTVLIVAHRPAMVEGCDQIVELVGGRVVQREARDLTTGGLGGLGSR